MSRNLFLEGNFAPVSEEISIFDLEVEGAIPKELSGRYLRTGPNPYSEVDPETHHWFTGDGMLHGIALEEGQAKWYRNRWTLSPQISKKRGLPQVPKAEGGRFDGSGNTNVVHHGGKILAINELSLPYEISPELETLARVNFGGPLPAGTIAHPKFDPASGEMFIPAYDFQAPFLRLHVIDPQGQMARTVEIPVAGPIMAHDFSITENFVIFFDLPVVFNMEAAMQGVRFPYEWNADYVPRVGILPKQGTGKDMIWMEVNPCFIFHPFNAYEAGDEIVLDFVRHPKMFASSNTKPGEGAAALYRWKINQTTEQVSEECLDERGQEFPRIDERLLGSKHRYGYAISSPNKKKGEFALGNKLFKHDFQTATTRVHNLGKNILGGEFAFVPERDDSGEDEGWLMGYVYNKIINKSDFLILDASNMKLPPVARVKMPQRVPFGFHGNWIPNARIGL